MTDILTKAIQLAVDDGTFEQITRNRLAQFGVPRRPLLGPSILPEREVEANKYSEDVVRYRTVIANDGGRYSPAQLKDGGEIIGTFDVELGNQDIKRQFDAAAYDGFKRLLMVNRTMDGMAQLIDWFDTNIVRALVDVTEKQRWQAIVDAQVVRVGDNNFTETVTYPNPAGHRFNAGGTWSSDAYDPWTDIVAGANILWDKGYEVNRIITSRRVVGIMQNNDKVAARPGTCGYFRPRTSLVGPT